VTSFDTCVDRGETLTSGATPIGLINVSVHLNRLVRLTVRAGNDHGVAVRVFDPDLAMPRTVAAALWRVAMRRSHDRCVELLSACYDLVEIGHLPEPQQDTIADLDVWAHEESVVVFDISMVQLKDEDVVGEQPLVVRTSVITTEVKELLIPQVDASTSRTAIMVWD
jgi:hypothetical protein